MVFCNIAAVHIKCTLHLHTAARFATRVRNRAAALAVTQRNSFATVYTNRIRIAAVFGNRFAVQAQRYITSRCPRTVQRYIIHQGIVAAVRQRGGFIPRLESNLSATNSVRVLLYSLRPLGVQCGIFCYHIAVKIPFLSIGAGCILIPAAKGIAGCGWSSRLSDSGVIRNRVSKIGALALYIKSNRVRVFLPLCIQNQVSGHGNRLTGCIGRTRTISLGVPAGERMTLTGESALHNRGRIARVVGFIIRCSARTAVVKIADIILFRITGVPVRHQKPIIGFIQLCVIWRTVALNFQRNLCKVSLGQLMITGTLCNDTARCIAVYYQCQLVLNLRGDIGIFYGVIIIQINAVRNPRIAADIQFCALTILAAVKNCIALFVIRNCIILNCTTIKVYLAIR